MTLTSDITLPPTVNSTKQAQKWLDDLPLPENIDLDVHFESLDVATQYFKKITLSVKKGPVETIGASVRSNAVENGDMLAAASWAKGIWAPHVSLMYADIEVSSKKHKEILQLVIEAGILIGNENTLFEDGKGGYHGWHGGQIALVETWKDLRDWEIVASRVL